MPLRDHFRPPVSKKSSWQGFHGGWPMAMVQQLVHVLPARFVAEPRVNLGEFYTPSVTMEMEFPEQYAYEVLILDMERERQLVAAIEIVSPANKDRPENRQLFISKCVNLLQKGVCVSIVDLVTIRRFNLYVELLTLLRGRDPAFDPTPSPTYAATCRKKDVDEKTNLETWSFPLTIGESLPQMPIWLSAEYHVMLDLEASYEETCRALRIP